MLFITSGIGCADVESIFWTLYPDNHLKKETEMFYRTNNPRPNVDTESVTWGAIVALFFIVALALYENANYWVTLGVLRGSITGNPMAIGVTGTLGMMLMTLAGCTWFGIVRTAEPSERSGARVAAAEGLTFITLFFGATLFCVAGSVI